MVKPGLRDVPVWDLPVRFGHWLLVSSFVVAWLSADGEEWRLIHVGAGTLMAAIVLFRVLWGFVGSRHARFADFVAGPKAAWAYLAGLIRRTPHHHTGHNPAGGYAILLILGLVLLVCASGLAAYNDIGGDLVEKGHDVLADLLLAVIGIHLAGVVVGSLAHRENLVRAMVTGRKRGPEEDAIANRHGPVAAGLLIWAALAVWLSRFL